MTNREILMNAIIELDSIETSPTRESLRKNWVNALKTAEYDEPNAELDAEYSVMMAELQAEKENNRRKFQKTHRPDNKTKTCNPDQRKKNRNSRRCRLYGLVFEDGHTFYWETKSGAKKFPEYEADIIRNLKIKSAEKSIRCDTELEIQNDYFEKITELKNLDLEIWRTNREICNTVYEQEYYEIEFETYLPVDEEIAELEGKIKKLQSRREELLRELGK